MTALATGIVPASSTSGSTADDDRIISKSDAAKWANLSVRSWERHEAAGTCPPRVCLGNRRVGYWKSDVRNWLLERTGPKKAA